MDLLSGQERFSGYLKGILVVIVIAMGAFILFDFVKVRMVQRSLHNYMDNLRDLTFMSAYDSLKKGNMKIFTSHLQALGRFTDVKEFSLLNAEGEVRYSSRDELKGQIDPAVRGLSRQLEQPRGKEIVYYFPVLTTAYCLRCHPDWQEGGNNSFYRLTLSRQALLHTETVFLYYFFFVVFGGLLFMFLIYMIFEVVERRRHEQQLLLSASVFDNIIEAIIITDHRGMIQKVNQAFATITGFSSDEAIGQNIRILNAGQINRDTYSQMRRQLRQDGQWTGEIWNRRPSGESYPAWLSVTAVRGLQGRVSHFVSIFHDITELKKSQDQLEHQVYHDALTGLPNRRLLIDRLEMVLSLSRRHEQRFAVLFIDLDNFKHVNDSAGHHVGDLFLKVGTERITQCCREGDTVARFGGDEFVMVLPEISGGGEVDKIIRRIRENLARPVVLEGHELSASASFGVTIFPDDGSDVNTLLKNADMAMYQAKEQGKDQCVLFTGRLNVSVRRRIELEGSLKQALQRGEFQLFYQPQVDMESGAIVGVETLLRWVRPDGEMVMPAEFIPLAEHSGLILPLGEWVLETASRQGQAWSEVGFGDLEIGVNLSGLEFLREGFVEKVFATLLATGLSCSRLNLELTESMVLKDMDRAQETFGRLSARRIKISIDDFGTGYASLGYLKKLPFDCLKIDRSFIRDITHAASDQALVKAVLYLSQDLGLTVIAEGVETPEQLAFLWRLGCKRFQGYLFSPPVSAEAMEDMLRRPVDWRQRYPVAES